jgi:hypothetical protein
MKKGTWNMRQLRRGNALASAATRLKKEVTTDDPWDRILKLEILTFSFLSSLVSYGSKVRPTGIPGAR